MTSEQDLLNAIIKDPWDDGPKLVFADWKEEHGETEIPEFIRGQLTLQNPTLLIGDTEKRSLFLRMNELQMEIPVCRWKQQWDWVGHALGRMDIARSYPIIELSDDDCTQPPAPEPGTRDLDFSTTTMHNSTYRRHLGIGYAPVPTVVFRLKPQSYKAQQLFHRIADTCQFLVTFPDQSTFLFFGFVKSGTALSEDEWEFVIQPTGQEPPTFTTDVKMWEQGTRMFRTGFLSHVVVSFNQFATITQQSGKNGCFPVPLNYVGADLWHGLNVEHAGFARPHMIHVDTRRNRDHDFIAVKNGRYAFLWNRDEDSPYKELLRLLPTSPYDDNGLHYRRAKKAHYFDSPAEWKGTINEIACRYLRDVHLKTREPLEVQFTEQDPVGYLGRAIADVARELNVPSRVLRLGHNIDPGLTIYDDPVVDDGPDTEFDDDVPVLEYDLPNTDESPESDDSHDD